MTRGMSELAVRSQHEVRFYRDQAELSAAVAGFVGAGLRAGERTVMVARSAHRPAFAAALARAGVGAQAARARGDLVILDAAATLRLLLADGQPDPTAFRRVVGGLVRGLAATGRPARVYSEMVTLLMDDGNVGAALSLEAMWNALAAATPISLLCAYPRADDAGQADAVLARHTGEA